MAVTKLLRGCQHIATRVGQGDGVKLSQMIVVDELATFMNVGWPGEDWYLNQHAEYLWEQTFTAGDWHTLYQPRQPGTLINLYDFEARVRWQGGGTDPTGGVGYKLSELFLSWQRKQTSVAVLVYVPRGQVETIKAWLTQAGYLLSENISPNRDAIATRLRPRAHRMLAIEERIA